MAKMSAVLWSDAKAYFFRGSEYVRYDVAADKADEGYPQSIASGWAGVFDRDIDAAVVWPNGKAYFFRGGEYVRYDVAADKADEGYPQSIASGWAGVFDRDIDAAVVWPNGKAYFFRGGEYVRYDVAADKADEGYPQSIASGWAGVFDRDIDAAVVWPNGKAYFFRGGEYVRYDVAADKADEGYPQSIASGWPTLFASGQSGATAFSFQLQPGEAVGARVVRCCNEALAGGQMGQFDRHDFYRSFIACNAETSEAKAEALTTVRTSCAMFVRAIRAWSGAPRSGPYVPGTGMFVSMGNVSFNHPAFVPNNGSVTPNPGDNFYISSSQQSNDGHTGIFIEEIADGRWRTAEGGGGGKPDGTLCRFVERSIVGNKFDNDARTLWGWFDVTKVGLPA